MKAALAMTEVRHLLGGALISCAISCADTAPHHSARPGSSNQELASLHGRLHFFPDATAGFRQATQHRRPCLLFFTTDLCSYCQVMANTTLRNDKVANLAENFICIFVDADHEPQICHQYNVNGYPTILFLSSDGHLLHRLVGLCSAGDLAQGMETALSRFAWIGNPKTLSR